MDWKDRYLKEIADLKGKIERLSDFTCSDKYDSLNLEHQMLLDMQLRVMLTYMDVLVLRSEHIGLSDDVAAIFGS